MGSEMCIRDSTHTSYAKLALTLTRTVVVVLITLTLVTVAKDNRANARLKATKLKKLRDPPSSELPYQRNKETRHEYLQDSGPDLVSAPLPSFHPSVRPSFIPSVLAGVGRTGGGRVGSRARIPYGGLGVL